MTLPRVARTAVLLLVASVGCDKADGDGDESGAVEDGGEGEDEGVPSCWEQETRTDCDALGDLCQFEPGQSYGIYADGTCAPPDETETGWCVPKGEFGGAATGSVWYHEATGRVLGFGVGSLASWPPGWEACPAMDALSQDYCPSMIEMCQVCVCDGAADSSS